MINISKKAMKKAILEFVQERDSATFAELSGGIEGFNGNVGLEIGNANIFVWVDMSVVAVKALNELLDRRQIFLHPTNLWIYHMDGLTLNIPIAKRLRKYKEPHWLPAVLRTIPQDITTEELEKATRKLKSRGIEMRTDIHL